MHNYESVYRRFPSGVSEPNYVLWSAALLPFLEQQALFQSLVPGQDWSTPGSNNANACQTALSVFRCPSQDTDSYVSVQGIVDRIPCNYLGVASGSANRESGADNRHLGATIQDGLLFLNSRSRFASIRDGSSNTLAIGEALFLPEVTGKDLNPSTPLQIIDHWYIGTDGMHRVAGLPDLTEVSEAIGSTAAPMNARYLDVLIDEKEIGFSSHHAAGCQFGFADGHVALLSENIDRSIYSALGTIAGGEVATPAP